MKLTSGKAGDIIGLVEEDQDRSKDGRPRNVRKRRSDRIGQSAASLLFRSGIPVSIHHRLSTPPELIPL